MKDDDDTEFKENFELNEKDDSLNEVPKLTFIQKKIKTKNRNKSNDKSIKDKKTNVDLSNHKGFSFNDEK